MKKLNLNKGLAAFAAILISCSAMNGQNVVVPNDIIPNNSANSLVEGWRLTSVGNSTGSLVAVADLSIPADFGPHSIHTTRPGGEGLNRSFLGYYRAGKVLSDVQEFSWNAFADPSSPGNDSYLNIFITNGTQFARVVYNPTLVKGVWQKYTYSSSAPTGNLIMRTGGDVFNISQADLIANYGTWMIYNHPNSISMEGAGNFLGGITIISGSSSPSQMQTHTYDGVTVKFTGEDSSYFDFVNEVVVPPSGCSAVEVMSYNVTKRNDGSDLLSTRTISANALGAPQNSDVAVDESMLNFVALGFGGSIVLRLSGPVTNGPGNDLRIVETTYGASSQNCLRYPERVQVYVSQDGCNWVYTSTGCQDVDIDFGPLNWAEYVKLVDVSPIDGVFENQIADGYDVDGIICLNGPELNPVMQDLGALYAVDYSDWNQGLRKNNTPVAGARSNPLMTLGAPQNTNTVNFAALGFGGSIILKLGYVVFDKPGNDLQLTETSFGNPSCASYPERALIEVSLDKITWISLGIYCLDAGIDFSTGGAIAVQYVRIQDRSARTSFSGTADGYDIDGLSVLQPGCSPVSDARLAVIEDDISTADEIGMLGVSPNPFKSEVALDIVSGSVNEQMLIRVMNITGQIVFSSSINIASNTSLKHILDLSILNAGMYFISVESKNSKETLKVIKQ